MSAAEEAARMPKRTRKHVVRKIVLRLPDLDHAKTSVLNSLSSPRSRRNYKFAMEQFITWYCSEPRLALNRMAECSSRRSQRAGMRWERLTPVLNRWIPPPRVLHPYPEARFYA